ncbi:MAG: fibronectin type III domain-containing protein [Chitinophagaceae bacterium]|nr:fibronectin type III domain-containing protein [Chitinophagaceae bacterium]
MKKAIGISISKVLCTLVLLFAGTLAGFSQNSDFVFSATNFTQVNATTVRFDVSVVSATATNLKLGNWQFGLNVTNAAAVFPVGTVRTFTFVPNSNTLPGGGTPGTLSNPPTAGYNATSNAMRATAATGISSATAPTVIPGVPIFCGQYELTSSLGFNTNVPLNLAWNPAASSGSNTACRVNYYVAGATSTTNSGTFNPINWGALTPSLILNPPAGPTSAVIGNGSGAASGCAPFCGNIAVTVTGGTPPFTVVYTDGTNSYTVTNYISGTDINVCPSATATYTLVSVSDGIGSSPSNSGSATLTVNNAAPVTISSSNGFNLDCINNFTVLSTGTGLPVVWTQSGAFYGTADPIFVPNFTNGPIVYGVTVTDGNGCTATSSVTINMSQPTSNTTTASACDTYTWAYNGTTYTSTGVYTAAGAGSLTVNLTSAPAGSFMDEVEWVILNSSNVAIASGGPYSSGVQSYTATVTPSLSDYPVTFAINAQGFWNDNIANYQVICNGNNSVLTSGLVQGSVQGGPDTYTSGPLSCLAPCHTEILDLTITPSTSNTTTTTACDTYTWAADGQVYTASGSYTYVNPLTPCHTEILNLTITPSTSNTTTASACDTYTWAVDGQTYTASGSYSYVDPLTPCHTEILALTITPSTSNTTAVSACDTYTWTMNGQTYTASGIYSYVDPLTPCHTEILDLTINASPVINSVTATPGTICAGATSQLNVDIAGCGGYAFDFTGGMSGWTSGTMNGNNTWAAQSFGNGANSLGTPNIGSLGWEHSYIMSPALTFPAGNVNISFDSYSNNEGGFYDEEMVEYSTDGGATWNMITGTLTPGGLASTYGSATWITYTTSVVVPATTQYHLRFRYDTKDGCCGPSNPPIGWYIDNVSIGNPCSSTVSWSPAGSLSNASISNPVATPSATETYTVTVTGAGGCTATGTVTVNVNQPTVSTTTISACDSYTWPVDGNTYTASGSYTYNNLTACTQDILNLTITPSTSNTTTIAACDTYTWALNGQTYTASGSYSYVDPLTPCHTEILALTITATPVITSISASPSSICEGQTSQLDVQTTGCTAAGCTYNVAPIALAPTTPAGPTNPGPAGDDVVSGAINIGFPFTFYCNTYTQMWISTNGYITFSDPFGNSGCCSGQFIPDGFNPNNVVAINWDDLNTNAGGNIDYYNLTSPNRMVIRWNGVGYFGGQPGFTTAEIVLYDNGTIEMHNTNIPTGTGQTQGIEDATGTLATVVAGRNASNWSASNDAYQFTAAPTNVCTYSWSPAGSLNNASISNPIASPTATTTYTVTVANGACSATATVMVNVTPVTSNTTTISACDTYTWSVDGNTYTATGIYSYVDPLTPCHTEILDLTITPSTSNTTVASACDTYTWAYNGGVYTATGIYSVVTGCHTEILDLTITPSTSNTTVASACDTYTWTYNGGVYTASGIYSVVTGCHTEILDLTITPSTSNTTVISACDTYTWTVDGNTYTSTGIYSFVNGCHTEILDLTITPSTSNTTVASACDTYTWTYNGATYTASGIYSVVTGCHTEILDLTITPTTVNTTTASGCTSYTWPLNGVTYTASGSYTFQTGPCSYEVLNLTIGTAPAVTGITISLVGGNSATVCWNAIGGIGWYSVRYRQVGAPSWNPIQTNAAAFTCKQLLGLTPGTQYEVQVMGHCSLTASGPWSASNFFTTLNACNAPAMPTASAITTTSATINWGAVPLATYYDVRYRTASPIGPWINGTSTPNAKPITGLAPGTVYQMEVRAWCSGGFTAYSPTGTFITASGCGIPTGLNATNVSATSATLNWGAVVGVSYYNVRYRVVGNPSWINTTSVPSTKNIIGLAAATQYEFQVASVCGTTATGYSPSALFTTASAKSEETTGLFNLNDQNVTLYPNPTKDVLNVDLFTETANNTTVKVLDMSGRVVKMIQARTELGMNHIQISLNELVNGLYTVQVIENDKLTYTGKVSKN